MAARMSYNTVDTFGEIRCYYMWLSGLVIEFLNEIDTAGQKLFGLLIKQYLQEINSI